MSQKKPKGPVMVVGGGIAGIQAALSLSEAGYGVHLLEHTGALGGMVPRLHRIYPLCACCKVDPRIAACQDDPNINVMVHARITDFSGELGAFRVAVDTKGGKQELQVGAVVLAAGIETFDPSEHATYAYGNLPNVVTSVEWEQMQKPLGPGGGILKRPSDGKAPKRIAWLQCVGSRDINRCDAPYCSSVCCMYALKEAVNAKAVDDQIEATIFYMDMRTHGKGHEGYLDAAVNQGIRLIRSRVHTVEPAQEGDDLLIAYADEGGRLQKESFDMVVLSVGIRPSREGVAAARQMGVDLTDDLFVRTEPFRPVSTHVPGIFVCGGIAGPHDIHQSLIQATAAVSEIAAVLTPEAFSAPTEYPAPLTMENQEPKVLVAYHLCPGMPPDMGKEIETYALKIPGVALVARVEGDIHKALTDQLQTGRANRLIFASCTPLIHKSLVEKALRASGLHPYLYDLVDLRAIDPPTAAAQIRDRLRMGVTRGLLISPPTLKQIPVVQKALVVGAGVSGLESALAISRAGYPVVLVEKGKEIGGHARHVRTTWQGFDVQAHLKDLVAAVESDPNITLMTETRVTEHRGVTGSFVTALNQKGQRTEISHGVTVLACGGDPARPKEYLLGEHPGVCLWSDLEQRWMKDPASVETLRSVVFIQCVGSREPERPYCSKVCCTHTVKSAVQLKKMNPEMDVVVLYRDIRTYGQRETLYREARRQGVIFIRYDLEQKPAVMKSADAIAVTVRDPILGRDILIHADLLVLASAIVPGDNTGLAQMFKLSLNEDGFFMEAHAKLRPVEFATEGVFVAGMAHYPKPIEESMAQAKAAASRASVVLSREHITVEGAVSHVNEYYCLGCGLCVEVCPFGAISLVEAPGGGKVSRVQEALCKGCGACAVACPSGATQHLGFEKTQIYAMIDEALT